MPERRRNPPFAKDDADIELDTQELIEATSEEPLGYGPGEWASGPFPLRERSDVQIRDDLRAHLTRDVRLDASAIEVDVRDGHVTLHGRVPTREMRHRADDVALDIAGAEHVTNDLRIAPSDAVR